MGVTILVGSNMTGAEKFHLLIVAKYVNPRCFCGIRTLPAGHEANKNAWATKQIFEKWTQKLDSFFGIKRGSILLIVDNCSSHFAVETLKPIASCFFPPDTTCLSQPVDQMITRNLKHYCIERLLSGVFLSVDAKENYHIDVLGAVHMLAAAWAGV